MEEGGGSGPVQDEKLAHFQSLTGVEDMALCARILESYGWDLDAAVSAAVEDDGSLLQQSQQQNQQQQQQQQQLRYPSRLPRPSSTSTSSAPLGLAQLAPQNESAAMSVDQQEQQPLINNNNIIINNNNNNNNNLVWKIVTLPFNIVRGGLMVATGALGLGVWVAGSLLNYSLGAIGLAGDQNRAARIAQSGERFFPVATPGSVQASQFIRSFELDYGSNFPSFLPLSFMEALRRSSEEFKFLFVYLHSPEHVDTPTFCTETLCAGPVVEFLNQNFVSWGADVRNTEGFQMFNSFKASTFPFCAVVMASSNQRIALLQQMEGLKSPETVLMLLQRVLEEQGPALVAARAEDEERRRNRQLRQEQDAAYQAALLADQERERKRLEEADRQAREAEEVQRQAREKEIAAERAAKEAAERQAALEKLRKEKAMALGVEPERGPDVTQVLVRFPNGERKERRFSKNTSVQSVYDYVDSLGCLEDYPGYSLVSNFPRKVYSADKLGLSLTEAGLHPHASLYVQIESQ